MTLSIEERMEYHKRKTVVTLVLATAFSVLIMFYTHPMGAVLDAHISYETVRYVTLPVFLLLGIYGFYHLIQYGIGLALAQKDK